ncbi:MAG: type 4a pilus biogenesis protein PilO [Planctomycetota bacterium]|jgi:Tfp pilus assembly protein PilO
MLVENLARLDHSKRNAASASLVIIAAFAMYNWTVKPHSANLSSARAHESVTDENTRESKTIATKVETRRKMLQRLHEQSEQLLDTLFTSDQAREFFSDIEVISGLAGCSVNGINLISNEQKSEHEHLGIRTKSAELNVVGSYKDITELIRTLQTRSQRVWFDSVELQSIDYNSDEIGCSLAITICEIIDKDTS